MFYQVFSVSYLFLVFVEFYPLLSFPVVARFCLQSFSVSFVFLYLSVLEFASSMFAALLLLSTNSLGQ